MDRVYAHCCGRDGRDTPPMWDRLHHTLRVPSGIQGLGRENKMIASERALFIMSRINELGVVNLKDIAAQMGTSETTVRRDFEKL